MWFESCFPGILCAKILLSVCAAGYEGVGSPGEGCTQCRAGRVKAFAGNAACTDCPAGQTSVAPFTACTDCPPDEYSANAADTCSPCNTPSETTNTATGQTECRKYNDIVTPLTFRCRCQSYKTKHFFFQVQNETFLLVCAAGYSGAGSPGAGCTQCTPGTFKATVWNAACGDCNAGQGSSAPFTSCTNCPADHYSANPGDPCSACNLPSETTDTVTGQTECRELTGIPCFQECMEHCYFCLSFAWFLTVRTLAFLSPL